MHPVIVGKRALPSLAPSNDPTACSTLSRLARPDDIALAISHGSEEPPVEEFLAEARRRGLLTIALGGGVSQRAAVAANLVATAATSGEGPRPDQAFIVPSDDPMIVQEVQETSYHVLWELVHVFFEHPGLLDEAHGEACITCGDAAVRVRVVEMQGPTAIVEKDGAFEQIATDLVEHVQVGDELLCHAGVALQKVGNGQAEEAEESTGFLYPFQGGKKADLDSVLADIEASTRQKADDVIELRRQIDTPELLLGAQDARPRLDAGGRLIAFGNGGSATDAQDIAADALALGWPAVALGDDSATVTAVGNDVGFENVFARQLIALGGSDDVAIAISTSGNSPNLVAGLEEAHRRGMLTIGIAGYDGGRLAKLDWLDHLFVVPSDYIPRIQEAQATIYHLLLEAVGAAPTAG
jgi:D-sedoheptulose 7-phosphate isomerase